jgi:hypothetical protein
MGAASGLRRGLREMGQYKFRDLLLYMNREKWVHS